MTYIVTSRARVGEAFREVARHVESHAGIRSHTGKLKAWCRGEGAAPDELADVSADAWTADLPDHENGLVILGVPLGKPEYIAAHAEKRMMAENKLLKEIPLLADGQKAWDLLAYSAVPRADHCIRTLPPSQSQGYARIHDDGLWGAFLGLLGADEHGGDAPARIIATLPARLGGLGLRSAQRAAKAAYWASWVDALPVLASKTPWLVAKILGDFRHDGGSTIECLRDPIGTSLRNTAAAIPDGDEAQALLAITSREAQVSRQALPPNSRSLWRPPSVVSPVRAS